MLRRLAPSLAVLALLVLPGAAAAGTPVAIGAGAAPVVAVDPSGAAHVAYVLPNDHVGYCKLPRGATTCSIRKELFTSSQNALDRLNIFAPTTTDVQIYANLLCTSINDVARFASSDGGANFDPPVCKVPSTAVTPTSGENLLDAQGRFLATSISVFTSSFLALPPGTTQSPATSNAQILTPGDSTGEGSGGISLGKTTGRLAATVAYDEGIRYSVFPFDADTATLTNLNNANLWIKDKLVAETAGVIDVPTMASGPAGIFMAYLDPNTFAARIVIRRLDPATNTFGPATLFDGDPGSMDQRRIFQDTAGRLHLTWTTGSSPEERLRYAVSSDGGASFVLLGTLAPVAGLVFASDVGAAPDGRGWAVYQDNSSIAAVPLEATPDPPAGVPLAPPAPPAVVTPTVTPTPRVRPGLSATVRPKRDRRRPYRYTTRGKLTLPSGVTQAAGCKGKVRIGIKRKGSNKTLSSRLATVNSSCRFTSKVSFKNSRIFGTSRRARRRGTLVFRIRFQGNAVLLPRRITRTARYG